MKALRCVCVKKATQAMELSALVGIYSMVVPDTSPTQPSSHLQKLMSVLIMVGVTLWQLVCLTPQPLEVERVRVHPINIQEMELCACVR